eukprot:3791264-Rhodomonas_salina.1
MTERTSRNQTLQATATAFPAQVPPILKKKIGGVRHGERKKLCQETRIRSSDRRHQWPDTV